MADPIRVFLLDDHDVVREGLRFLLEQQDDIEVVGESASAVEAAARIPALRPDVAVLDARLPDGSRVNAVVPPLSIDGSALTIRKFSTDPLTVDDLIRFGSLSDKTAAFLEACVRGRLNIISHLLSQVPYKPLAQKDVTLPKRQRARGYVEPQLPLRYIPTPF